MPSLDSDQLPPLLSSMVNIEGLPRLRQSKYVHEAENRIRQYVERYQIISFDSYCRVGLSFSSYVHPRILSLDRLVVMSIVHGLGFLLDDLFIDNPVEFLLDQYGIDRSIALGSPHHIKESLDHLNAVFGQQKPPHNPASLIEVIMGEMGREMLHLSNPEWFNTFAESVVEHHHTSVASLADVVADHNLSCIQDLESYTIMRAGNVGGKSVQLLTEFASNTYIPKAMRSHPFMLKITAAASAHIGFANDVYSYHKESSQEGNPRNLITVLMESQGKSLLQAVHAAIDLVNKHAHMVLDLESEAWNPILQIHLQDIKELIVGNVCYGCMDKRYRQPDSIFPDLRDTTSSWKLAPLNEVKLTPN